MAKESLEFDWQIIGSRLWLKQQFDQCHNDDRKILKKLDDLEQQNWVLFAKMRDIERAIGHLPGIAAASLGITFDPPELK